MSRWGCLHPVLDGGIAPPVIARRSELDGRTGRSIHVLQAGGVSGLRKKKETHEKDFFDGIDTSLLGLDEYAEPGTKALPGLKQQLGEIAKWISEATDKAKGSDVSLAAPALTRIVSALHKVESDIDRAHVSGATKR